MSFDVSFLFLLLLFFFFHFFLSFLFFFCVLLCLSCTRIQTSRILDFLSSSSIAQTSNIRICCENENTQPPVTELFFVFSFLFVFVVFFFFTFLFYFLFFIFYFLFFIFSFWCFFFASRATQLNIPEISEAI